MKNSYLKYIILTLSLLFISEMLNYILGTDKLLQNSLSEQLTARQIEKYIEMKEKWRYFSYVFIAIYMLLKTSIIASTLYIGVFFRNKDNSFNKLWDIVLNAEFIFLLVPIFKTVWLYFFESQFTLEDVQYFFPLSLLNIGGYEHLEPWLMYPLQTFNLFELTYIIYLGYQLGSLTQTNPDTGLKIVAYSYVPALVLWITFIMFLTLNYN
jgi:hypothetical protein